MSHFHPLEVVGRGSETQFQVGENNNRISSIILGQYSESWPENMAQKASRFYCYVPVCTEHRPNIAVMLVHRLRRWPNIETTLGQCIASDEMLWYRASICTILSAGLDGSFVSTEACNLEVLGLNPGREGTRHRGCAYTVLQTVQMPGVYSTA